MGFETYRLNEREVNGIREAIEHLVEFRDGAMIGNKQLKEQKHNIRTHIDELLKKGNPAAAELDESYKINFSE